MRLPFLRAKAPANEPAQLRRTAAAGVQAEGPVQAARTQARRRLIGALVLLAAGVIGFPVLFETQPRPLPVNTPILLPEGTPARVAEPANPRPLPAPPALPPDAGNEVPATPAVAASVPPVSPAPASAVAAAAKPVAAAPVVSTPKAAAVPPEPTVPAVPAVPAVPVLAPPKPTPPPSAPAAEATGRFVVQVGAYNDVERMKAARQKLEKLGFKTFTQDVDTATGKRTRVRVGPFGSRQDAEAVATKVKAAGMQAAILSL